MSLDEIRDILQSKYPEMDVVAIRHDDLVFEERVRLKCMHCTNYREKWTCPGRLPDLDFQKIVREYEHLAVIISRQKSDVRDQKSEIRDQMSEVRFREAANGLHRAMLYLEGELFKRGNAMAEAFIGCGCQLCKDGCPKEGCAHPEQARVPWDATGCNVVKTLANIGVSVEFPPKEYVYQYGLMAW
ncbi:MAG: hypothetical protein J6P74_05175 [Paludibacteraceae bacterium]|nr:hypothetical protein [Paludibacteraceae bacterium]